MNYPRHFELRRRARFVVAAILTGAFGIVALSAAMLHLPPAWRTAAAWAALAIVGVIVVLMVVLTLALRALDRLEKEDAESKPWMSRPRILDDKDCPF